MFLGVPSGSQLVILPFLSIIIKEVSRGITASTEEESKVKGSKQTLLKYMSKSSENMRGPKLVETTKNVLFNILL
jgi:hypothetical protein